ncbi:hypothetical protein [Piscinibacter sp. HJYY11]|uniref:hypothetical protein n=1 Tax=Piscinibacter sp. HJYY11 TaxID=2801333 RepID=UPI00191E8DFD|nr:hypothetical protein [Piscinibacter sp. HJYY11]MBL0726111.1 hypothetical protein [Piscinibacter sp. HJYY11]
MDAATAAACFRDLSRHLAGVDAQADLAAPYLQRLRAELFGARIDELLELFARLRSTSTDLEMDIRQQIVESSDFGALAQQIILLWYTSAFADGDNWKFGPPEQYFRSHIWSVIGAHPPALSGGYFGYWKYPPEN